MKEPVDHIARPQLPWRTAEGVTECGLNASKVNTLSRAEYFARFKDMGQQRTAMLTCMTCANTAQRWKDWETDPREALGREIDWESHKWRGERGQLLRDELVAIAALIEEHRAEFEQRVAEIGQRREWIARKATVSPAPARPRPLGIL